MQKALLRIRAEQAFSFRPNQKFISTTIHII